MAELPKLSNTELAIGAGALAIGAGVGAVAIVRSRRKKARKRKAGNKNSRKRRVRNKRKLKFGSKAYRKRYLNHGRRKTKQKKPRTAGKRRDTSRRRIRYTKNNQPYVILSSGKARFISKKSVSNSRKRSGGRY